MIGIPDTTVLKHHAGMELDGTTSQHYARGKTSLVTAVPLVDIDVAWATVYTHIGLHPHCPKVSFDDLCNPLVVGVPVMPPCDSSPYGLVLAAPTVGIVSDADRPVLVRVAATSDQICNRERDSLHVHGRRAGAVVYMYFKPLACLGSSNPESLGI